MQTGTNKIITKIKEYKCGYCINDLGIIFSNKKREIKHFHAKAFLIFHKVHGYILIDTGYTKRIFENGWRSKTYNLLNKTICNSENYLVNQLKKDGIENKEIKNIILTHLHPDHIGGLKDFPDAKILMAKECDPLLHRSRVMDLVFNNLLPEDIQKRKKLIDLYDRSPLKEFKGFDLYNDNSIWLINLEGHAIGQMGVFLPEYNLFIIADTVWGTEFINEKLKFIPRFIQSKNVKFLDTIECIKNVLKQKEIQIITSHGAEEIQYE